MNTVALLVTGALGMLGWFFAWLGQRAVVAKDREVADARAGEAAAKSLALEAQAGAAAATARLSGERARADGLQMQLDAERKARQDLVHDLAKKGVPVGDAVVDSAMDRLYPDDRQGGQGASAGSGGDSPGVSGQPARAAGTSGQD